MRWRKEKKLVRCRMASRLWMKHANEWRERRNEKIICNHRREWNGSVAKKKYKRNDIAVKRSDCKWHWLENSFCDKITAASLPRFVLCIQNGSVKLRLISLHGEMAGRVEITWQLAHTHQHTPHMHWIDCDLAHMPFSFECEMIFIFLINGNMNYRRQWSRSARHSIQNWMVEGIYSANATSQYQIPYQM